MESEIIKIVKRELEETPSSIDKVGEGLVHNTYTITCDNGEYIIQFSEPNTDNERALERGAKFYGISEELEFPVPQLVAGVNTIEKNGEEIKYFIVEKLDGKTLEKNIDQELAFKAGKMLAEIHNIEYDSSGWLRTTDEGFKIIDFDEGSMKDWILSEIEGDTETLEENGMGKVAEKVRKFFEEYGDLLPREFQPVLCHNDFSRDNILAKDEDIKGVIDFDYAFSGHRQRDLVKTMNSFAFTNEEFVDDLYRGYKQKINLDNSFKKNRLLYNVETLNRIISSTFTLKEDVNEEDRERYREMLNKAIEEAEQELN